MANNNRIYISKQEELSISIKSNIINNMIDKIGVGNFGIINKNLINYKDRSEDDINITKVAGSKPQFIFSKSLGDNYLFDLLVDSFTLTQSSNEINQLSFKGLLKQETLSYFGASFSYMVLKDLLQDSQVIVDIKTNGVNKTIFIGNIDKITTSGNDIGLIEFSFNCLGNEMSLFNRRTKWDGFTWKDFFNRYLSFNISKVFKKPILPNGEHIFKSLLVEENYEDFKVPRLNKDMNLFDLLSFVAYNNGYFIDLEYDKTNTVTGFNILFKELQDKPRIISDKSITQQIYSQKTDSNNDILPNKISHNNTQGKLKDKFITFVDGEAVINYNITSFKPIYEKESLFKITKSRTGFISSVKYLGSDNFNKTIKVKVYVMENSSINTDLNNRFSFNSQNQNNLLSNRTKETFINKTLLSKHLIDKNKSMSKSEFSFEIPAFASNILLNYRYQFQISKWDVIKNQFSNEYIFPEWMKIISKTTTIYKNSNKNSFKTVIKASYEDNEKWIEHFSKSKNEDEETNSNITVISNNDFRVGSNNEAYNVLNHPNGRVKQGELGFTLDKRAGYKGGKHSDKTLEHNQIYNILPGIDRPIIKNNFKMIDFMIDTVNQFKENNYQSDSISYETVVIDMVNDNMVFACLKSAKDNSNPRKGSKTIFIKANSSLELEFAYADNTLYDVMTGKNQENTRFVGGDHPEDQTSFRGFDVSSNFGFYPTHNEVIISSLQTITMGGQNDSAGGGNSHLEPGVGGGTTAAFLKIDVNQDSTSENYNTFVTPRNTILTEDGNSRYILDNGSPQANASTNFVAVFSVQLKWRKADNVSEIIPFYQDKRNTTIVSGLPHPKVDVLKGATYNIMRQKEPIFNNISNNNILSLWRTDTNDPKRFNNDFNSFSLSYIKPNENINGLLFQRAFASNAQASTFLLNSFILEESKVLMNEEESKNFLKDRDVSLNSPSNPLGEAFIINFPRGGVFRSISNCKWVEVIDTFPTLVTDSRIHVTSLEKWSESIMLAPNFSISSINPNRPQFISYMKYLKVQKVNFSEAIYTSSNIDYGISTFINCNNNLNNNIIFNTSKTDIYPKSLINNTNNSTIVQWNGIVNNNLTLGDIITEENTKINDVNGTGITTIDGGVIKTFDVNGLQDVDSRINDESIKVKYFINGYYIVEYETTANGKRNKHKILANNEQISIIRGLNNIPTNKNEELLPKSGDIKSIFIDVSLYDSKNVLKGETYTKQRLVLPIELSETDLGFLMNYNFSLNDFFNDDFSTGFGRYATISKVGFISNGVYCLVNDFNDKRTIDINGNIDLSIQYTFIPGKINSLPNLTLGFKDFMNNDFTIPTAIPSKSVLSKALFYSNDSRFASFRESTHPTQEYINRKTGTQTYVFNGGSKIQITDNALGTPNGTLLPGYRTDTSIGVYISTLLFKNDNLPIIDEITSKALWTMEPTSQFISNYSEIIIKGD